MPETLLALEKVSLQLGQKQILEQVDLSLKQGEITTLIGPNGAGKSSLARIVLGLVKPSSGKINRRAKLRLGYMPQKLNIDPSFPLTVLRFLLLAQHTSKAQALATLKQVDGQHLAKQPIQVLSGGEFQRVLLARAILRKPELLVLDEPVQGVDMNGQRALYPLITRVRDEFNCAVLMISHDLHLVMKNTDQVVCLNKHVCCAGHPDNVTQHPAYLKLFGEPVDDELAIYTHHHDHQHDLSGETLSGSDKPNSND